MKLAEFIVRDAIVCGLTAATKELAVEQIVASLAAHGRVSKDQAPDIVKAIMRREELGSTGIGNHVAVPHTKHASVDRMVGVVAVTKGRIDFQSIDREPVDIIFLLISPPDRPGDHLRALELISRNLRHEMFCRFLRQATAIEAVWDVIQEADDGKFG